MGETRKLLGLGLILAGCLGALGTSRRAAAQEMTPGPPPMERAFGGRMLHGRWWDDPQTAQKIGLTADQQTKMDGILQQHRLKLIDLNASLQKQEAIMQPLIEADQPDEGKILGQIDAIAQARAELEKANARMLLGIRQVLTPDQWTKLKALRAEKKEEWGREGRGMRRGPGGPPALPDGGPPPQPQME
ncbi:periplasmic heavy metal sensor [Alloacidobacterium dinghuense]|uniref:Periplasmic heavy metal sensor n=1 Tax=Alloacidobacterium dinghuense TaxID=2763107 RepID=A0A7G8BFK8_9BACT|nr:periplasmic heavy metal sensor [Alloacidobacterium dinghuense]QNI31328.1 periplasmic heavy metal sensor [Alloacidobacterium dinghuense]